MPDRPLDFAGAERLVLARLPHPRPTRTRCSTEEFMRALFERTVHAVRTELHATGRAHVFAMFERYDLVTARRASAMPHSLPSWA